MSRTQQRKAQAQATCLEITSTHRRHLPAGQPAQEMSAACCGLASLSTLWLVFLFSLRIAHAQSRALQSIALAGAWPIDLTSPVVRVLAFAELFIIGVVLAFSPDAVVLCCLQMFRFRWSSTLLTARSSRGEQLDTLCRPHSRHTYLGNSLSSPHPLPLVTATTISS